MVDTVKLLLRIDDPMKLNNGGFVPSVSDLVRTRGFAKSIVSIKSYSKLGTYMPRLTLNKRILNGHAVYQLGVEFSAPKLIYGNNFEELSTQDFEKTIDILQSKLNLLTGYIFSKDELKNSEVTTWHPSKNIVFRDYTSCMGVLNTLHKLDVSKVYDVQKTNFRDGHAYHIHCNSLDIAFYDKLSDLKQAKISEKRSLEFDSQTQFKLLDKFTSIKPLEILRYEVRLGGKAKIKRTYPEIKELTFVNLFNKELCKQVLLAHWRNLTTGLDMLAQDVSHPFELLQNVLLGNEKVTPRTALAQVGGLMVVGQEGSRGLRALMEARFGKSVWSSLKPMIKQPKARRYEQLVKVEESLKEFSSISLSSLQN